MQQQWAPLLGERGGLYQQHLCAQLKQWHLLASPVDICLGLLNSMLCSVQVSNFHPTVI